LKKNLKRDNNFFIQCALRQAEKALAKQEVPVGAVVVLDGKIIAKGFNRCIIDNDPTAHAEIVAVRKACKKIGNYRLTGAIVFTTVEPCLMCMGVLVNARVKKIVFGCYDKKAGACGSVFNFANSKNLNHKIEIEMPDEPLQKGCSKIVKDFFRDKRKH
jgi:tRNA(adenine34) deaminase